MALSTISLAEGFSKERLQPSITISPKLVEQFGDAKSRDGSNTILYKEAKGGGHLILIGSNSSAEMRSRPIKVLLLDEVSSYQPNKEGDVVDLLIQRQVTFFDKITVLASTPLFTGDRILSEYEKSDQRRFFVHCPHCGAAQWLKWGQVKWPKGQPRAAQYECEECQAPWAEKQRRDAINAGYWLATSEPDPGYEKIPGFHISALYSPWQTLAQLAVQFYDAQGNRLKIQTFTNTKLAQGFEVREYNAVDYEEIQSRAESYAPGTVPMNGLVLTAGVDVQKDRLVVCIWAWGEGEESWLIAYLNLYGSPLLPIASDDSPWPQLDQLLGANYRHESGAMLKLSLTGIDSGYATQEVYKYVLARRRRYRVRAFDGLPGSKRPITAKPSFPQVDGFGKPNKSGVKLWGVGTTLAKKTIYSRLALEAPGPGYLHTPQGTASDFYSELTGEQIVIKYKKGFPYEEWELRPGRENHALDCTVYALAAAHHLRINMPQYPWQNLRDSLKVATQETPEPAPTQAPKPKPVNKFTGKQRGEHFKRRQ